MRGGKAVYRVKFPQDMHTNAEGLLLGAVFLYDLENNEHRQLGGQRAA